MIETLIFYDILNFTHNVHYFIGHSVLLYTHDFFRKKEFKENHKHGAPIKNVSLPPFWIENSIFSKLFKHDLKDSKK